MIGNLPGEGLDPALMVDTGLRCSADDKLLLLDHDGDRRQRSVKPNC